MGTLRNEMIETMKLAGYSEKTIKLYVSCVGSVSRYFGRSPLGLSSDDLSDFFLHLRESRKSESTIHIYYEAVKRFYSFHNLSCVVPHIAIRRIRSRMPVVLSQEEIARLFERCESLRFKTIFMLIYSSGLRVSEAANLQVSDIDLERRQILVRNGKNRKDRYTIIGARTCDMLKTYFDIYRPISFVFFNRRDITSKISVSVIQKHFKKLLRLSNVTKDAHIHTLRHSFATHLLENGTSIFHIMHLLGHSNITTTLVYFHMQNLDKLQIKSPIDILSTQENPTAIAPNRLAFQCSA